MATITHVIDNYVPIADQLPVEVAITGEEWYVQKAAELINAAQQMYDTIGVVSAWLHRMIPPTDRTQEETLILGMLRDAETAARGAITRKMEVAK